MSIEAQNLKACKYAIENDADLKEFRKSLNVLLTSMIYSENGSSLKAILDFNDNPQLKAVLELIEHREGLIRESFGVNISYSGTVPAEKSNSERMAEILTDIDEYLSENKLNNIGNGSKIHQDVKEILNKL